MPVKPQWRKKSDSIISNILIGLLIIPLAWLTLDPVFGITLGALSASVSRAFSSIDAQMNALKGIDKRERASDGR